MITIDVAGVVAAGADNALHGALLHDSMRGLFSLDRPRQALARRRSRRSALLGPLLLAMQPHDVRLHALAKATAGHRLLATIVWLVTLRREKLDVGTWTFLGVVANI